MACRCEEKAPIPVVAAPAVVGGAGTYFTGRQYIGTAGFDSPFDVPTPTLVLKSSPSLPVRSNPGTPWIVLAAVGAAIAYFYLERRK